MSVNSTCSNDSLPHPQPSLDSFLSFEFQCFTSEPGCFIFTVFTFISVLLLLPLYLSVLHRGFQRFPTTHSDSFAHHLALMELFNVFGCILACIGIYNKDLRMLLAWFYLSSVTFYGETFFHVLTCVEHYLAVVRPIAYLTLKQQKWIRVRNVVNGCIWLLCLGWTGLMALGNNYLISDVCLLIISVVIISFCSLSVLCVLIRPGPGQKGRDQVRVDQSRQRAFLTIVAILGVLLLRFACCLVGAVQSLVYGLVTDCVSNLSGLWLNLPGSLVLPVLFVQRMGTPACCGKT